MGKSKVAPMRKIKNLAKRILRVIGLEKQAVRLWICAINFRMSDRIRRNGMIVLFKALECIRQEAPLCFADFGTLLGVIREGKLLGHDLDVDTGVLVDPDNKNVRALVRLALIKGGFKLRAEFILDGIVVEESFYFGKVKVDVSYYDLCDGQYSTYLFYGDPGKDYAPGRADVVKISHSAIERVQKKNVQGYELSVPENSEAWLACKYGENWRVPNKGWVYWKGNNAVPIKTQGIAVRHLA